MIIKALITRLRIRAAGSEGPRAAGFNKERTRGREKKTDLQKEPWFYESRGRLMRFRLHLKGYVSFLLLNPSNKGESTQERASPFPREFEQVRVNREKTPHNLVTFFFFSSRLRRRCRRRCCLVPFLASHSSSSPYEPVSFTRTYKHLALVVPTKSGPHANSHSYALRALSFRDNNSIHCAVCRLPTDCQYIALRQ